MSARLSRRAFLASLARAGAGSAVLVAMPAWARRALAASSAPPDMIERNEWPEHWETTLAALGRSWTTPDELFFVRSHFPAPAIDAASWRLEVSGLVKKPLSLSLVELRELPALTVPITIECAGNGRGLYHVPSTSGTQWERGAVGNASWSGVRLATVLERAGVEPGARHVWFEAADAAPLPGVPKFLRSIPLEKALDDTLLAWGMNGAALSKLHGAPLRAIVPGWYGMASTKWVTRVRVEAAGSDNHFMVKGYRYNYPGEAPTQAKPVEEMRVKSLITRPLDGAHVAHGKLKIEGFAWGGPLGVSHVEVSSDGGVTWASAEIAEDERRGAWRAWSSEIEAHGGDLTLMARATDSSGAIQPLEARANAGGYANNSIHRVGIHVRA